MNPILRYIITRPCLSEGTLTVAKYLEPLFPAELAGQTLHLMDEQGRDYPVQLSKNAKRLSGVGALYHHHNLDVNDVLLISSLSEGRYQVNCVVKPHTERLHAPRSEQLAAPTRQVFINATPHVREVRLERAPAPSAAPPQISESRPGTPAPPNSSADQHSSSNQYSGPDQHSQPQARVVETRTPSETPGAERPEREDQARVTPRREPSREAKKELHGAAALAEAVNRTEPTPRREPPRPGAHLAAPTSKAAPLPEPAPLATVGDQLSELALLTGYHLEYLGGADSGPVRLRANLGQHSYDVTLALTDEERRHPAFGQGNYRALLSWEADTVTGPRFTREALEALLEHARLAPLTPIDLRGYWNTASFDLDSVASLAELVSAHLVQRGTFTYLLGVLAQQPPHSIVDPNRLAERLGSGINSAELHASLETLCRAPFMALLPLPGGQFYLRSDVPTLLAELSEYAQGVSRRLVPARARA